MVFLSQNSLQVIIIDLTNYTETKSLTIITKKKKINKNNKFLPPPWFKTVELVKIPCKSILISIRVEKYLLYELSL